MKSYAANLRYDYKLGPKLELRKTQGWLYNNSFQFTDLSLMQRLNSVTIELIKYSSTNINLYIIGGVNG